MEIINSTNITINVNTSVFTVTCDNSDGISLKFQRKDDFELVAWANAKNCTLTVEGNAVQILPKSAIPENSGISAGTTNEPTVDLQKDQIVTRKLPSGEIVSKVTRRDHAGRIVELV